MEITTPKGVVKHYLDVGQTVYYMKHDKIVKNTIVEVRIEDTFLDGHLHVSYRFKGETELYNTFYQKFYTSLDALIDALTEPFKHKQDENN
jgi:hypothetical protein